MRIVFFTPIVQSSAIAKYSLYLVDELIKKGHDVIVIRTELEEYFQKPTYKFNTLWIDWNKKFIVEDKIVNSDILIYQIGDCYLYHKGALEYLKKYRGIIILHDYYLKNLFNGWALENQKESLEILKFFYSDKEHQDYPSDSTKFKDDYSEQHYLTEWICSMSLGVLTHSSQLIQKVLDSAPGPVVVSKLPYLMNEGSISNNISINKIEKSKLDLLTFGNININKRVKSVISAIGKNYKLKNNIRYHLAGEITSNIKEEVLCLAKQYNIDLVIHGYLDDESLIKLKCEADAISCLRFPVLEAASATVIESMFLGKPIIVTDHGHYSELPDDLVFKISINNEVDDIENFLLMLIQKKINAQIICNKLREYVLYNHSLSNYVEDIFLLIDLVNQSKSIFKSVSYFNMLIYRWEVPPELIKDSHFISKIKIFNN